MRIQMGMGEVDFELRGYKYTQIAVSLYFKKNGVRFNCKYYVSQEGAMHKQ